MACAISLPAFVQGRLPAGGSSPTNPSTDSRNRSTCPVCLLHSSMRSQTRWPLTRLDGSGYRDVVVRGGGSYGVLAMVVGAA